MGSFSTHVVDRRYCVGPEDQTQVLGLGNLCLYPSSHLASLQQWSFVLNLRHALSPRRDGLSPFPPPKRIPSATFREIEEVVATGLASVTVSHFWTGLPRLPISKQPTASPASVRSQSSRRGWCWEVMGSWWCSPPRHTAWHQHRRGPPTPFDSSFLWKQHGLLEMDCFTFEEETPAHLPPPTPPPLWLGAAYSYAGCFNLNFEDSRAPPDSETSFYIPWPLRRSAPRIKVLGDKDLLGASSSNISKATPHSQQPLLFYGN